MTSLFITRDQAMKMLDVSENTFRKLRVPYYKIGGRQKFRVDEVEQWLINQRSKDVRKCASPKGKVPRSTGMISPLTGLDFEQAVKQTTSH